MWTMSANGSGGGFAQGLVQQQAIVKNTFVERVEEDLGRERTLQRSCSDSDLSRSSGEKEKLHFWLPSLSSGSRSSTSAQTESREGDDKASGAPEEPGRGHHPRLMPAYAAVAAVGTPAGGGCSRAADADHAAAYAGAWNEQAGSSFAAWSRSSNKLPLRQPNRCEGQSRADKVHAADVSADAEIKAAAGPAVSRDAAPAQRSHWAMAGSDQAELCSVQDVLRSIWHDDAPNNDVEPHDSAREREPFLGELGSLKLERLRRDLEDTGQRTLSADEFEELQETGVLQAIPTDENGALSSVGSAQHFSGECSPCAYWFKGICKYGILCRYCHFVHQGQKNKRLRPSKKTRMRLRRFEMQRTETESDGPDGPDDESIPAALQ